MSSNNSSSHNKRQRETERSLQKPSASAAVSGPDPSLTPTLEFYSLLQRAYDHFNGALFNEELPQCLITLQREHNAFGFVSHERWVRANGERIHELALNPAYFARYPLVEVFQTLVHEQVHIWQGQYGKPSRSGYHNGEWADKMQSIGLMPSHTGCPGGKRTGQKMADYAMPGGAFVRAAVALICCNGASAHISDNVYSYLPFVDCQPAPALPSESRPFSLSIAVDDVVAMNDTSGGDGVVDVGGAIELLSGAVDTIFPGIVDDEVVRLAAAKKRKTKYQCGCGTFVWGRPALNILCGECKEAFVDVD